MSLYFHAVSLFSASPSIRQIKVFRETLTSISLCFSQTIYTLSEYWRISHFAQNTGSGRTVSKPTRLKYCLSPTKKRGRFSPAALWFVLLGFDYLVTITLALKFW
jgi:hypothetical protein